MRMTAFGHLVEAPSGVRTPSTEEARLRPSDAAAAAPAGFLVSTCLGWSAHVTRVSERIEGGVAAALTLKWRSASASMLLAHCEVSDCRAVSCSRASSRRCVSTKLAVRSASTLRSSSLARCWAARE